MVKQPLEFTVDALMRYPMVTRKHFVECGGNSAPMFSPEPIQAPLQALHGLASCAEWTGVPLSILLDEAGADPKATWMIAEGADSLAVSRSVPMKKAYDDAIVALYQNGERIMPGNGYPMRLLLPGYEGNMNTKFLRRIKVVDQPAMTYYESRNYSPLLPDGKAYKFYFVNEVKSFITQPSFGNSLKGPGFYEISGIAYSGTGRIDKVMVSADGGKSWGEAAVEGPASPQAFTRFTMPWKWDGQPAVLTSRAWDDSGAVQPLRADFVAVRGQANKVPNVLGFPEPALQQPHRVGHRRQRGDQACLRLNASRLRCVARWPADRSPAVDSQAADSPHLGKPISEADIKAWDISVLPDGTNLPPGSGNAAQGAKVFVDQRLQSVPWRRRQRRIEQYRWSAIRR